MTLTCDDCGRAAPVASRQIKRDERGEIWDKSIPDLRPSVVVGDGSTYERRGDVRDTVRGWVEIVSHEGGARALTDVCPRCYRERAAGDP